MGGTSAGHQGYPFTLAQTTFTWGPLGLLIIKLYVVAVEGVVSMLASFPVINNLPDARTANSINWKKERPAIKTGNSKNIILYYHPC